MVISFHLMKSSQRGAAHIITAERVFASGVVSFKFKTSTLSDRSNNTYLLNYFHLSTFIRFS